MLPFLLASPIASHGQTRPVPPLQIKRWVDTSYAEKTNCTPWSYIGTSSHPGGCALLSVASGGNFQLAIDKALPGDVIELEAGATFVGKFILRNKVNPQKEYIHIRSSEHRMLPPAGERVVPAQHAKHMAKLLPIYNPTTKTGERSIIRTELKASYYRLIGIEITKTQGNSFTNQFIVIGEDAIGRPPYSISDFPHHIIIDRSYLHGNPGDIQGEGARLHGSYLGVVDSFLSEIHGCSGDEQAIGGFNTPGPLKIINNHIEAAGINILFGGGPPLANVQNGGIAKSHDSVSCVMDPNDPNKELCGMLPSDIEIRGNLFYKQPSWETAGSAAQCSQGRWGVKNLFELKNSQRVLLDGNIFENNWIASNQPGFAVVFTPKNQFYNSHPIYNSNYSAPWTVVQDIIFTHNIVKNSVSAVNFYPRDPNLSGDRPSDNAKRYLIKNNLFYEIERRGFEIAISLDSANHFNEDIKADHNTLILDPGAQGFIFLGDYNQVRGKRVSFTNNILSFGQYGIFGSLAAYLQDFEFENNAIIDGAGRGVPYPGINFYAGAISTIGFVDISSSSSPDYTLSLQSPYRTAGTDGLDLGADIAEINKRTSGTGRDILPPSNPMRLRITIP